MDNTTATQAHQQRAITAFFSPSHAISQSRAARIGSQPGHRPQPQGTRSHQAIISCNASLASEVSLFWIGLC